MADSILTVNAGSSSIKFALFEHAGDAHRVMGQIDGIGVRTHMKIKGQAGETLFDEDLDGADDHHASLAAILRWFEANIPDMAIAAVGHRVVHGGVKYAEPVKVTAEVADDLEGPAFPGAPASAPQYCGHSCGHGKLPQRTPGGLFRHGIPSAASLS
jgi:Acetate kinase